MNEWRRVAFSLCSPIIHSTRMTSRRVTFINVNLYRGEKKGEGDERSKACLSRDQNVSRQLCLGEVTPTHLVDLYIVEPPLRFPLSIVLEVHVIRDQH